MKNYIRLDKIITSLGYGSRKEVKALIKAGGVVIDQKTARDAAEQIDISKQTIVVNGKQVFYREFIYIMMNKPQGVISATEDKREKTVIDLLTPEQKAFNPAPVGRLDKDTEGLLLLTNDGELAHRLLSPKKHVPKTYYAKINGRVTDIDVAAFGEGVILEDGYKTLPAELTILSVGSISEIEICIYEGKFHQVKRMFQAVNKEVIYLKRIAMGKLLLDTTLDLGEFRELTEHELGLLNPQDTHSSLQTPTEENDFSSEVHLGKSPSK